MNSCISLSGFLAVGSKSKGAVSSRFCNNLRLVELTLTIHLSHKIIVALAVDHLSATCAFALIAAPSSPSCIRKARSLSVMSRSCCSSVCACCGARLFRNSVRTGGSFVQRMWLPSSRWFIFHVFFLLCVIECGYTGRSCTIRFVRIVND